MRVHQSLDGSARRIELRIDEARALYAAVGLAALHAMQSRCRQSQRREQFIEGADSSPAHQSDSAAQALRDFAQQCNYFRISLGLRGCVGEFDQRSVNIQKQTPV